MVALKEAREKHGIKQKAVADALKATRQTYAKYEENPRDMPVFQAEAACAFDTVGAASSNLASHTMKFKAGA